MSELIIIRGNSGSGKTTIAKLLRKELGDRSIIVSQDMVRREILDVSDQKGNPAIQLIYDLCMYGERIGFTVIVEGIMSTEKYKPMLEKLLRDFSGPKLIYYFDLTYEETLRRHGTRPKAAEFGHAEMQGWWKDKDYLGVPGEMFVGPEVTKEDLVKLICSGLRKY